MAASGTVGILRALITAEASAYQASLKKSADATKAFGSSVAATGQMAQRVTPQLTRLEKAFQGDKLLYTANNLTKAITNIGGAAKLTAREHENVNRQLTEAIAKYRALGQTAPKAMVDLERATRKAGDAATGLSGKMVALGSAVGSFVGTFAANLVQRGISSIITLGFEAIATAGKIDDMSKKLGVSAEAVQGFSFAAEQTGTTLEAFGSAITRLNINLAEGNKSTVGALKALGVEVAAVRAMRPEDAFLTIADALAKVENPMERVRLGTELMGRGFAELMPAIEDGLRDMVEGADKMSNATVQRLAAAEDAWAKLRNKVVIVTGEMLASIAGFIDRLREQNFGLGLFGPMTKGAGELGQEFTEVLIPALGQTKAELEEIAEAQRQAAQIAREQTAAWREAEADAQRALDKQRAWLYSVRAASYELRQLVLQPLSRMAPVLLPPEGLSDLLRAWAADVDLTKVLPPDIESQAASVGETIGRSLVDEFSEQVAFGTSQMLSEMLVGLQSFKEAFTNIWRGIRQVFANILADMLGDFIKGFLQPMLKQLAATRLGTKLAKVFGGATTADAPAGGTAPAWAGFGAKLGALASNPITWGIGAGALLAWGIGKKGWLRGGEEGTQVNPARDRFLQQFGPSGTGEGSGFHTLAAMLTNLTGEPGGGRLFRQLTTAKTMSAFRGATQGILTLLQRRNVSIPRFPTSPQGALTAATSGVMPGVTMPAATVPAAARTAAAPVTMNVTIQAWDRADMSEAFRTEIIPRFKDAIALNQSGLRTTIAGVG